MKGRRSSYTCSFTHHHHHHHGNGDSGELTAAEMKKGPWKVEEDEVLLNHVKKYGPRDWSSIQSKGLLQRSGKSCRLRWVNKLRPNLKNGVKFSAEEERIVIDLQAEFGNKWARIATYLPGRTDNDVKNFWSSRRKRLARILHNNNHSAASSSHSNMSPEKNSVAVEDAPAFHHASSLEAQKLSSMDDEQEAMLLSKPQSCSSSSNVVGKSEEACNVVVPAMPPENIPNPFIFEPVNLFHPHLLSFPEFPQLLTDDDIALPPAIESLPDGFNDNLGPLWDPSLLDMFGSSAACDVSGVGNGMQLPFPAPEGSFRREDGVKKEAGTLTPESFIDDFPIDMFDHIEPLPSPSDW
nr:transcription factor DUO1 [Ipomoea batatas]